jgi:small basic protein
VPILGFVTFLSIIAQTVYMEYRIGVYIYPLFWSERVSNDSVVQCRISEVRIDDSQERQNRLKTLDTDLENILEVLRALLQSTWQVLLFIGPFFGFIIFDIIGDEFGYRRALWAPVSLVLICVTMYLTELHRTIVLY